MTFAASQPVVNQHCGGADFATALRTHLLANVPNRVREKARVVANAVAATSTTVRMHPLRLTNIIKRNSLFLTVQDCIN